MQPKPVSLPPAQPLKPLEPDAEELARRRNAAEQRRRGRDSLRTDDPGVNTASPPGAGTGLRLG